MQAMPLGDFRDMAREALNSAPKGEEGKEPTPDELERQVGGCGCCLHWWHEVVLLRHGVVRHGAWRGVRWHGMA